MAHADDSGNGLSAAVHMRTTRHRRTPDSNQCTPNPGIAGYTVKVWS